MLLVLILGVTLLSKCIVSSAYVPNQTPQIVTYEINTDNLPNSYNFHYDTSDGSSRAEQGSIQNPGTKDEALDVKGAVRWYDDKGNLYEMIYKAGKRGYNTIIRKVSS